MRLPTFGCKPLEQKDLEQRLVWYVALVRQDFQLVKHPLRKS
jgi:hypothetical protein